VDNGDSSVSRRHAVVRVLADCVHVKDEGSTYGTYVGEKALESSANNSQEDRISKESGYVHWPDGERVRFGLLSSVFRYQSVLIDPSPCWSRLVWRPIKATTSGLPKQERQKLGREFTELKRACDWPDAAALNLDWSDDVTHVVMDKVILTVKAVNALAKGTPIVTPAFFADLRACCASKQPLPSPPQYVPKLAEASLDVSAVSCATNPQRARLFQGMTFVFGRQEQRARYALAVEYAGGRSFALDDQNAKMNLKDNDVLKSGEVKLATILAIISPFTHRHDSDCPSKNGQSGGFPSAGVLLRDLEARRPFLSARALNWNCHPEELLRGRLQS